jgi:hypothetical protein
LQARILPAGSRVQEGVELGAFMSRVAAPAASATANLQCRCANLRTTGRPIVVRPAFAQKPPAPGTQPSSHSSLRSVQAKNHPLVSSAVQQKRVPTRSQNTLYKPDSAAANLESGACQYRDKMATGVRPKPRSQTRKNRRQPHSLRSVQAKNHPHVSSAVQKKRVPTRPQNSTNLTSRDLGA